MHWPLKGEGFALAEREPSAIHLVQHRVEWSRFVALPGEVVIIDHALRRSECRVMRAGNGPARHSRPTPGDTREPGALAEKAPEAVADIESAFDGEVCQVMRQVAPCSHRRTLE